MKNLVLYFIAIFILSINIKAQNVGIGTSNTRGKLTVLDSTSSYNTFLSSNKFLNTNVKSAIGFGGDNYVTGLISTIGVSSSNARMGFSTGYSFTGGTLNLLERLTIANNGFVGINNVNPQAYLDLNGGMKIAGANSIEFGSGTAKEINAGKIGYQLFTTGMLDFVGAGTNSSNRKIRFWNEGGGYFEGGIHFYSGKVTQASTGGASLLPYAYGTVGTDGAILNGSGNFTVTKFGVGSFGIYLANGESFSNSVHTATVSIASDGTPGFIKYYPSSSNPTPMVVSMVNSNATNGIDRVFSFIIYKP